jgi:hypothetical protein
MPSEMIERVAKVLQDFKVEPPEGPVPWDKVAIAAIEAMREPTEEMCFAPDMSGFDAHDMSTKHIWQDMIDAALK